jgi:integrase
MITNIKNLEDKAREVFMEFGYSESTVSGKLLIVRKVIRLHIEHSAELFDKSIADAYIEQQELRHQNNEIGRSTLTLHKTVVEYLTQIANDGMISYKYQRHIPALCGNFEGILSNMLANEEKSLKFRHRTTGHVRVFLRWLSVNGHTDLSRVDYHVVREYFTDCSTRMCGKSLTEMRRALKELFLFTSQNNELPESMHKLFLFKIPIEKKILPFMPADEIAAVLNVIDRNTAKGKRDYAAILLAAVTGLRGCDIVGLSLSSIDWRNGEIKIIQEKTEKALALPLTTDVAGAIREYILNARPVIKSDKVFLCTRVPFNGINRVTLSQALQLYRIKAGLTTKRGFHSLRRWFATNMVTSGVSVITVSQALGTKVDSTRQYISLDSSNLKECALDFSGIQIGGDLK